VAPLPVRLVDERFTTSTAHGALAAAGHDSRARRQTVDAAAAAVLLEAALESERRTGDAPGDLVTAGRLDEARAVLPEAKTAAGRSGDACSRFVLELAESGLEYADDRFARALELVERAQRSGRVAADEAGLSPQYWRIGQARRQLTTQWLCDALTVVDRLEESLEISTGSITAARHERQAWALNIFETGRARQWLQMGRLADAGAALAKLFTSDLAHQVVSVLDAAGVVALGRDFAPERLIASADAALYQAKRAGRNRVRVGELGNVGARLAAGA